MKFSSEYERMEREVSEYAMDTGRQKPWHMMVGTDGRYRNVPQERKSLSTIEFESAKAHRWEQR